MFKTAWDWLVKSSADPARLSLTLRAGIPFVLLFFGWAGFDSAVVKPVLDEGVETVVQNLVNLVTFASGLVSLWGLFRKVKNTVRGSE